MRAIKFLEINHLLINDEQQWVTTYDQSDYLRKFKQNTNPTFCYNTTDPLSPKTWKLRRSTYDFRGTWMIEAYTYADLAMILSKSISWYGSKCSIKLNHDSDDKKFWITIYNQSNNFFVENSEGKITETSVITLSQSSLFNLLYELNIFLHSNYFVISQS